MRGTSAVEEQVEPNRSTFSPGPISHPAQPLSVLIVSADPVLRGSMTEILQQCGLKAVATDGLKELLSFPLRETVVACLCGFSLADGTIRNVAAYLKD
jgi:hypothetical protein